MSHLILIAIVLGFHFSLILSEWIEITQKPTADNYSKASKKIFKKSELTFSSENESKTATTTPSPEWIAYQRERFQSENSKTQKLIVSSGQHLRNSARIVVPASIMQQVVPETVKRNRIIQAKSKIEVVNNQPDKPDTQGAVIDFKRVQVETTSRRDISADTDTAENIDQSEIFEDNEDNVEYEEPNEDPIEENIYQNPLKYPSIQGFFKFIKSIQKNLIKKTGFSIESKIRVLMNLRDKLMETIEKRFTMLWQPLERKRSKRGLLEESNLSFPPEAALMSINFLTFAVFLIKLVLQVVHIVKSKHYSFTGFGVNTTTQRH